MNYWLILIPLLSAFVGWVTNRIAIRMLFRPHEPKRILGITFQGVIPKRHHQFAEKLGKLASAEFLSFNDIEQKISSPENLDKIMPMIENHIDDFLRHKLGKEMPMLSMFIGDKTINSMKQVFMKELGTIFPEVMKNYAGNLKASLNLEEIVTQKILAVSPIKLEKIIHQSLSKELRLLGLLGATIGFIIGLVQVAITVLTS